MLITGKFSSVPKYQFAKYSEISPFKKNDMCIHHTRERYPSMCRQRGYMGFLLVVVPLILLSVAWCIYIIQHEWDHWATTVCHSSHFLHLAVACARRLPNHGASHSTVVAGDKIVLVQTKGRKQNRLRHGDQTPRLRGNFMMMTHNEQKWCRDIKKLDLIKQM